MDIINKEIKDKIKQKIDENKDNIKCTEQIKNEVEEEMFQKYGIEFIINIENKLLDGGLFNDKRCS